MNWLSPLNLWATQNDIFQRRQSGTGEWLLADETFQSGATENICGARVTVTLPSEWNF